MLDLLLYSDFQNSRKRGNVFERKVGVGLYSKSRTKRKMEMMDDNYKIRREKEIKICEDINSISCDEIESWLYNPIPIKQNKIMTLTLVYSHILNKELNLRGLESSKIVLNNIRQFKSKLFSLIKQRYKNIDHSRIYKSII